MSTYSVEINGVRHSVTVRRRRGTTLELSIDGEEYAVSVAHVPPAAAPTSQGNLTVQNPQQLPSPSRSSGASGPELLAPIPGIVSDIKVEVGQSVLAGDTVIVLEAMKMENPIKAHRAGTIAALHVSRGQEVAHGAPLLSITE